MDNNMKLMGEILQEIRLKNEISLRELGLEVGISHTEIYNIERGLRSNPGIMTIIRICEALDIDFIKLVISCELLNPECNNIFISKEDENELDFIMNSIEKSLKNMENSSKNIDRIAIFIPEKN